MQQQQQQPTQHRFVPVHKFASKCMLYLLDGDGRCKAFPVFALCRFSLTAWRRLLDLQGLILAIHGGKLQETQAATRWTSSGGPYLRKT